MGDPFCNQFFPFHTLFGSFAATDMSQDRRQAALACVANSFIYKYVSLRCITLGKCPGPKSGGPWPSVPSPPSAPRGCPSTGTGHAPGRGKVLVPKDQLKTKPNTPTNQHTQTNQQKNKQTNKQTNQPTNQPASQPASQPTSQPASQPSREESLEDRVSGFQVDLHGITDMLEGE